MPTVDNPEQYMKDLPGHFFKGNFDWVWRNAKKHGDVVVVKKEGDTWSVLHLTPEETVRVKDGFNTEEEARKWVTSIGENTEETGGSPEGLEDVPEEDLGELEYQEFLQLMKDEYTDQEWQSGEAMKDIAEKWQTFKEERKEFVTEEL